jgi:hypothetical protein
MPTASPGTHRTGGDAVDTGELQIEHPVLAGIEELARLEDRLGELLLGQVRDPCLVPEAGQPPLCVSGEAEPLACFGTAHDALEHLLAQHDHTHRSTQPDRRDGRCDTLRADTEFRAEPAAHVRRKQVHLLGFDTQRIRKFLAVEAQHLQAGMKRQRLPIPLGDAGMRLHRRAVMTLRRVDDIHRMGRLTHGAVKISLDRRILERLECRPRVCGIDKRIGLLAILDLEVLGRMARLFKGFRNHEGDGLPIVLHLAHLAHGGLARPPLRRARDHALVGNHG